MKTIHADVEGAEHFDEGVVMHDVQVSASGGITAVFRVLPPAFILAMILWTSAFA